MLSLSSQQVMRWILKTYLGLRLSLTIQYLMYVAEIST